MSRRLDTNLAFQHNTESARLEAEARMYSKIRRGYLLAQANKAEISLSVLETDGIYDRANGISQGLLSAFENAVDKEVADYVRRNPDRVRHSLLVDWMNTDMSDQEKARREIADWYNNPKIAYFDTETTGIDAPNVPWSAAACGHDGISLLDIRMLTLDDKGNLITISPEAARVTGMKAETIAEFTALEDCQVHIIGLERLMQGGYILAGYNTQFDRGMICRALMNATSRTHRWANETERDNVVKRLEAIRHYLTDVSHWLETKDVFVRAIGLDPHDTPGRRTRLQDVARATNALQTGENQTHGALADCQLLARIVQNIRKEIDMTPKPKTAPVAKPTEEIQTEPENTGEWPQDALENIETLEKALTQAETRASEAEQAYKNAGNNNRTLTEKLEYVESVAAKQSERIRELENLCEQYAQSDGAHQHHEAQTVTWSDVDIDNIRFNLTIREGCTAEQATQAAINHVLALKAIRNDERVRDFAVGLKDHWKLLKGFDKPTNGNKPAADEPPADELEQRRNDKPATPKGNQPPAASKPNTPPPANKPAQPAAPQGNQPGTPAKVLGEPASEMYVEVIRNEINGENTYLLLPLLRNGKPADKPKPVAKRDVKAFEKALEEFGWTPKSFETPGESYRVNIRGNWVWGNPTDPAKPDGPRYHDNATYTVIGDEPF